jgi:hypothetical protein
MHLGDLVNNLGTTQSSRAYLRYLEDSLGLARAYLSNLLTNLSTFKPPQQPRTQLGFISFTSYAPQLSCHHLGYTSATSSIPQLAKVFPTTNFPSGQRLTLHVTKRCLQLKLGFSSFSHILCRKFKKNLSH